MPTFEIISSTNHIWTRNTHKFHCSYALVASQLVSSLPSPSQQTAYKVIARTLHDFVITRYFDLDYQEFDEPSKGKELGEIYLFISCSLISKAS